MATLTYNAVCFRFTQSGARLFGRLLGDVTWSSGFDAAIVQMAVPWNQYEALDGDYTGVGALEFYFRNAPGDGVPDFALEGWSVHDVVDSHWGRLEPDGDVQAVERVFTLIDFRRQYRSAYGGLLTLGIYNMTRPDGLTTRNGDGHPTYSLRDAMERCIAAARLTDLQGTLRPELALVEAPRDMEWDGAPALEELAKLLPLANAVIAPQASGTPRIWTLDPDGEVNEPVSVEDAELGHHGVPFETISVPEDRPDVVVVISAPTLAVRQRTLTGPDANVLDYVGLDVDGKIKPLDQLSYGGGSAAALAAKIADGWTLGDVPGAYVAAQRSAFRWLRISTRRIDGNDNPNLLRLPILTRLVDAGVAADDFDTARVLLPRLRAKAPVLTRHGYQNQTELADYECRVLDPVLGIIEAPVMLGRMVHEGDAADRPTRGFLPLALGDITLTYAHEARDAQTPAERYYVSAWRRDDNGAVERIADAGEIYNAMQDPASFVISASELRMIVSESGLSPNRDDLDELARQRAEPILLRGTRQTSTRLYRGYHLFECDHMISSVTWQQEPAMTRVEVNRHHAPASRQMAELKYARVRQAATDATRKRAEPDQQRIGAPQWARPWESIPLPLGAVQFWAEIQSADGSDPPYAYAWHEILDTGGVGAKNSGTHGPLSNRGEDPGRLDPDGTSASIKYPALPLGTRVRVLGYDQIAGKWWFDVTLQPSREVCPSGGG